MIIVTTGAGGRVTHNRGKSFSVNDLGDLEVWTEEEEAGDLIALHARGRWDFAQVEPDPEKEDD